MNDIDRFATDYENSLSAKEYLLSSEQLVDEGCIAKNALLSIGKSTRDMAGVGQTPSLLQDFEIPTTSMLEDDQQ
mgnify:CR=1 FL=1